MTATFFLFRVQRVRMAAWHGMGL